MPVLKGKFHGKKKFSGKFHGKKRYSPPREASISKNGNAELFDVEGYEDKPYRVVYWWNDQSVFEGDGNTPEEAIRNIYKSINSCRASQQHGIHKASWLYLHQDWDDEDDQNWYFSLPASGIKEDGTLPNKNNFFCGGDFIGIAMGSTKEECIRNTEVFFKQALKEVNGLHS